MVRRLLVLALASVGAGAVPAPASADEPLRQRYRDVFSTSVPGAPAGRAFAVDFFDPADPRAKPPAAARVRLELAPGARFDTAAIERCPASDAELVARGAGACPPGSRVGTNVITFDTGFEGPGREVVADVVFFNADAQLVILATERGTAGRVVARGRVGERTLDIEIPVLPGTPPDGAADRSERATFEPRGGYLTTPSVCPPDGAWVNRATYTYRDGVVQTVESRSPCDAGAPAATPAPAAARPACRSRRDFAIRLPRGLRRARVTVGGELVRVRRGRDGRLRARIDLRGRPAGRVAVVVAGRTRAGAPVRIRRTYRTCALTSARRGAP